jgi:hypothetical protein
LVSSGEVAQSKSNMNSQLNLLKALIRLLSLQYFIDIILLIVNSPERVFLVSGRYQSALSAAAFLGFIVHVPTLRSVLNFGGRVLGVRWPFG